MRWLWRFCIPIFLSLILFSIQPDSANSLRRLGRTADYADDAAGTSTKLHVPENVAENIHESALRAFSHLTPGTDSVGLYLDRYSDNLYKLVTSNGKTLFIDTETSLAQQLSKVNKLQGTAHLFVPEEVFFQNYDTFSQLNNVENLSVVRPNDIVLSTQRFETVNGFERVIQLRSDITLGVKTSAEIDDAIWLIGRELNPDDINVISLFDSTDDLDISNALNDAAGDFHIPLSQVQDTNMAFVLSHLRNKIVFVVGHVEDNAFVVRRADGSVAAKFAIADLEQEARKHNVTLVLLGCQTTSVSRTSGFVTPVRDLVVAQGIAKALKAKNYGQMLSSLAPPETPLIIRSAVADQVRLIVDISVRQNRQAAVQSVRVSTASQAAVAGLFPWLPSVLSYYFSAMFFSVFTFRRAWRRFKKVWSFRLNSELQGLWSSFYQILRVGVFIFLLPFYTFWQCFLFCLLLVSDPFRAIALVFRRINYIAHYIWVKVSKLMHS